MLPPNLTGDPASYVAQMKRSSARFQLVFGVIFTLAAVAFAIIGVIRPALQIRGASQWVKTPCVITQSSVVYGTTRMRKGHSKPTHEWALAYEYQFQGQKHRSTTYAFDTTQVTGLKEASQAVARLPVGSTTMCWVDPRRPGEAVLKRNAQQPGYLLLVPVILLAAGVAISSNALKTLRADE